MGSMNNTTRTSWPDKGTTVVTDAGLETWLLFQRGVELPAFAAYPLAATAQGRALLTEYLQHYVTIASSVGASPVLDAATWRANPDWAKVLGHDLDTLGALIDACIQVVADVRATWQGDKPFLINGPVGPRGDGYHVDNSMSPEAAAGYHVFQVGRMAEAGVDVITALTMGYVGEAAGIALAARSASVPAVVSFTLETDGRLPTGMPLGEAIEATDEATDCYPLHYMINCAHPTHFEHVLDPAASWARRIGGIRANASTLSHAELDEMVELDQGDPDDLASCYVALRDRLPSLHVVGGCCGTDHRHVAAIATAWQR
jgi:homocysteine S-methyltransferase